MAKNQDKSKLEYSSPDIEHQDNPTLDSGGGLFEIHVKGHLDSKWSEWLEGLELKLLENGEMVLFGPIVDQAALLGVLNKLSHMNLALLSVNTVKRIEKEKNE